MTHQVLYLNMFTSCFRKKCSSETNKLRESSVAVDHGGQRAYKDQDWGGGHEELGRDQDWVGRRKELESWVKGEEMSLFLIGAPDPVPDGPTSTRHFRGAGVGESCNRTQRVPFQIQHWQSHVTSTYLIHAWFLLFWVCLHPLFLGLPSH